MIDLEEEINSKMTRIWIPANVGVVDETLVGYKGHTNNPHHVFIARKPNPHGLKNWSLVDFSGYFLGFSLFRRVKESGEPVYEVSHATVERMSKPLPLGSLVIADSYFGSVTALEKLAENEKYALFSCNKTHPSLLFKEGTGEKVKNNGDSETVYGEVKWKDGETTVPFAANSFLSEGRLLCTMTTVFSTDLVTTDTEILVPDGSEEVQMKQIQVEEKRPEARVAYQNMMDLVDTADQLVGDALPTSRLKHWTAAEMWELIMLLIENGRKVFKSANGLRNDQMSNSKWKGKVQRALLGLPECNVSTH